MSTYFVNHVFVNSLLFIFISTCLVYLNGRFYINYHISFTNFIRHCRIITIIYLIDNIYYCIYLLQMFFCFTFLQNNHLILYHHKLVCFCHLLIYHYCICCILVYYHCLHIDQDKIEYHFQLLYHINYMNMLNVFLFFSCQLLRCFCL